MPDPIFDDPRLAVLYDLLEPDRPDLDAYVALIGEFGAWSVLDVGCGTGTLACQLADRGIGVVAVDPAAASLDVARSKPGADRVRWIDGDATVLPPLAVDLATMTGNVAQVFLTDESWMATLDAIRRSLRPGGHLVFETRDPARRGWESWTREQERSRDEIGGVGMVEHWVDLVDVDDGIVTFRWTFRFESTGDVVTSDSTLRFRERDEIEQSLRDACLELVEVRDAPDRPGHEWVFVARKPDERGRSQSALLAGEEERDRLVDPTLPSFG